MVLCFCSREDVARVLAGALQAPPEHGLVFQVKLHAEQLCAMYATLSALLALITEDSSTACCAHTFCANSDKCLHLPQSTAFTMRTIATSLQLDTTIPALMQFTLRKHAAHAHCYLMLLRLTCHCCNEFIESTFG